MSNGALEQQPSSLVTVDSPVSPNSALIFSRGEIPHGSGVPDYCVVVSRSRSATSTLTDHSYSVIQTRLMVYPIFSLVQGAMRQTFHFAGITPSVQSLVLILVKIYGIKQRRRRAQKSF